MCLYNLARQPWSTKKLKIKSNPVMSYLLQQIRGSILLFNSHLVQHKEPNTFHYRFGMLAMCTLEKVLKEPGTVSSEV